MTIFTRAYVHRYWSGIRSSHMYIRRSRPTASHVIIIHLPRIFPAPPPLPLQNYATQMVWSPLRNDRAVASNWLFAHDFCNKGCIYPTQTLRLGTQQNNDKTARNKICPWETVRIGLARLNTQHHGELRTYSPPPPLSPLTPCQAKTHKLLRTPSRRKYRYRILRLTWNRVT